MQVYEHVKAVSTQLRAPESLKLLNLLIMDPKTLSFQVTRAPAQIVSQYYLDKVACKYMDLFSQLLDISTNP